MKIVIVGGGTAGWLVSLGLAKAYPNHEYVNVSEENIVGVGESTTGYFSDMLRKHGVDELDFMRECQATPKLGINFINWTGTGDSFIHPIDGSSSSIESLDASLFHAVYNEYPIEWASGLGIHVLEGRTNFREDLSQTTGCAMHIDTFKAGEYLRKKAMAAGVQWIKSKIVNVDSDTAIRFITLESGERIDGDFFIDCSGQKRILMESLGVGFESYRDELPVNNSVIFEVENDSEPDRMVTTAHARDHGWIFEIPTRQRYGRGYIYSDDHATDGQIIDELNKLYGKVNPIKNIKFDSGQLEDLWVSNCIAFGLASAFLEPLQATSIHSTVVQYNTFAFDSFDDDLEKLLDKNNIRQYNVRMKKLYEDMKDFVSSHYTAGRKDTDFWNDINFSDKVKRIVSLANTRLTRYGDFDHYQGAAGQGLWNYTLAGLGHFKREVIEETFRKLRVIEMDQVFADYYDEYYKIAHASLTYKQFKEIIDAK